MGYYTVITAKPRSEWVKQAKRGAKIMKQRRYKSLDEFAEKDRLNCQKMLQAFDALGMTVDEKLAKKCGLVRYIKEEGVF